MVEIAIPPARWLSRVVTVASAALLYGFGGISPVGATPQLSLFAGSASGGASDGTGTAARFLGPQGIGADRAGNLYVADSKNHTIRKITPDGVVTTLAGTPGLAGTADGVGAAARFSSPDSVAVDGAGNVYVADSREGTVRKIAPGGVVTTLAGTPGVSGSADDTGAAAALRFPEALASDGGGNVYVADSGSHAIRKITPDGVVTTLAGATGVSGNVDGKGTAARFSRFGGAATDNAGNIYVTDLNAIRKITPNGVVTTLAPGAGTPGRADGTGVEARIWAPKGVATDGAGNLYVTDVVAHAILKITADGAVRSLAGSYSKTGSVDGIGSMAGFVYPGAVATDWAGNVYVTDYYTNNVRKITQDGAVTTLAGAAQARGYADHTLAAGRALGVVAGIATDSEGNIYLADLGAQTIWKITPGGLAHGIGGTESFEGSLLPDGFATDRAGNVYVADFRAQSIRKITPDGVSTALAKLEFGHIDLLGPRGTRSVSHGPIGLATDSAGNVYVADSSADTIRKITPDGVVTTLAGAAGVRGYADGTGAEARFARPIGVAADSVGNLYVGDVGNFVIRKITPGGTVTTLAGMPHVSGNGDGARAEARFSEPIGVAADSEGNIYVADSGNNAIREVTEDGVVRTVVGQPELASHPPGSVPFALDHPCWITVFGTTLYVSFGTFASGGIAKITNLP
jgi:sugar lactone lactonase YvrE